jgi:hypothetical protein
MAEFQYQKEVTPWEEPGIEPQPGLRKWQAGEEPPAAWFNWFWDACQKCFDNIKQFFNVQSIDDTQEPPAGSTAELMQLINGLANRIKVITGKNSYRDAPDTTIIWLKNAIDSINNHDPLGVPKPFFGATLPARHLWADGKTIGDSFSGASARANDDAQSLFIVLWEASGLQVYESSGVLSGRGVSAIADWNAHKRLSLPKINGRTLIGCDNLGGTNVNVVLNANAKIIGGIGGEENHTLTIQTMPSHAHGLVEPLAYYTLNKSLVNGSWTVSDLSSGVNTTNNTGGGQPHNNMQPWIACNYIFRY